MDVAGDEDSRFGQFPQQQVFFVTVDMEEQDNQVALIADQGNLPAKGLDQRAHVKGPQVGRRAEDGHVHGQAADDTDAERANFKHLRGALDDGAAFGIGHVRQEQREAGQAGKPGDLLPAVVELVVADGGGIEAHEVGDFVYRGAFVDGGHGRTGDEIPAV